MAHWCGAVIKFAQAIKVLTPGTNTSTATEVPQNASTSSQLPYLGTKQAVHFQVVLGVLDLAGVPYSKL